MKKKCFYFQLTTTATKILNGKYNNGNSKKLQNFWDDNKKELLNLVANFCFHTCAIEIHFHKTIRSKKYCESSKMDHVQVWFKSGHLNLKIIHYHNYIDHRLKIYTAGAVNVGGELASLASQCLTDSFSVTNPGGGTNPVLCGTNTGEHMYVDASDACNELNFQLGTNPVGVTGLATRSWSIKATQV